MWIRRIDRLIEARRDRKGLIHAISYGRAKEIYAMSEHKDLMIMHGTGGASAALRTFEQRTGGAILISPSMETGIDLPYDLCRYQIVAKVPIPDTRGTIMQVRCEQDPELRYYLAMQRLVQMAGRIVRAADDWGETLIVDDSFGDWFFAKAKKHAPRWFIDAVQFTDVLPPPLNCS
jgi:Rad3-related DNA helicase